jgi:hypothetical protein
VFDDRCIFREFNLNWLAPVFRAYWRITGGEGLRNQLLALAPVLLLAGCAMPGAVHRIGVEYNTAVAGMANELTLLNIVRAKEDMPLHYTAVSRLSGSVTLKGTASVNGQLKENQFADTGTHTGAVGPTTTITDTLTRVTTKGGNVYTPTFGGEINSGPTFDVAILDTQKFYQGILAAVPFTTVENYINQGYDNQLIIRLLVDRIDIKLKEDGPHGKAGAILQSYYNDPAGPRAKEFADVLACYELLGTSVRKPAVALAPLSRVTRDAAGQPERLKVDDLAKFDGKTLEVKPLQPLGAPPLPPTTPRVPLDSAQDGTVMIQRLAEEKRVAELKKLPGCYAAFAVLNPDFQHPILLKPGLPEGPPAARVVYNGEGKVAMLAADQKSEELVDVDLQITFRSAEGVIRYVGHYLAAPEESPPRDTWRVGTLPLFSLHQGDADDAIVSTELLRRRYAVLNDASRRRNMMVIALIEQLVNLHKESADRPITVPVQLVP